MRVGIDLGGTKIEGVLLDDGGEIVSRQRHMTPREDYDGTVAAIVNLVGELWQVAGMECSVGIGTPGAWHGGRGAMKNCNSTWLNGRALLPDIETALGRSVRIANDANCFTLSEAVDGAGRGAQVVFGVILGTGVGGGWAIDRRVLTGCNAIAGEWGHTPLPYFRTDPEADARESDLADRACYCGRKNCVESFLSGPGLERTYTELVGEEVAASSMMEADSGRAVVELYSRMLARSLAQIVNVMDPDVIVLGGGVSNVSELYGELDRLVPRYTFTSEGVTQIVPAVHGDSSGVRGAAWLQ